MTYDGTGKLAEAIAELHGISHNSQAKIAELIKQAKDALGIKSKAKILPVEQKLAIYQWFYDRLNPVQDVKQDETVSNPVYNVKQESDWAQVHFALTIGNKRTTVMLEGYLINAMARRKHGLTSNGDIRQWLDSAIQSDTRLDANGRLTAQVKRLIVESFV